MDWALVLTNAVVNTDDMLIKGIMKDLPLSIATLVAGTYTTWARFTNAVRQIHPNDLLRA